MVTLTVPNYILKIVTMASLGVCHIFYFTNVT